MALVLKTSDVKASVGSNPTLSVPGWLSLVEHSLWERDAAGSNPVTPIDYTYSNYGILLRGILARELGNSHGESGEWGNNWCRE